MGVMTILIGVALNCALALITTKLRFPLYLDTIGTIGVTPLAGMCPGILTGVLTNVLCSVQSQRAVLFADQRAHRHTDRVARGKRFGSISTRISLTLLLVTVILAIAPGWISINLYNSNIKGEYAENALHATRLVSKFVDPDRIDEYIRDDKGVPGCRETEEMLYSRLLTLRMPGHIISHGKATGNRQLTFRGHWRRAF